MRGGAVTIRRLSRAAVALTAICVLISCQDGLQNLTSSAPRQRPDPAPPEQTQRQAELRQARAERNRESNRAGSAGGSQSQRAYYAGLERSLLAAGKLREDAAPADAPLDADLLARNFALIALHDEYGPDGALTPGVSRKSDLHRWDVPVRVQLEFGPSIDAATRQQLRAQVLDYVRRLGRVSGHDITLAEGGGNFTVLVLDNDERRSIGPRLTQLIPDIPAGDVAALRGLALTNYCTVFAYSRGDGPAYAHAVALIRAELPPLLRLSCLHEELAQGLGLPNDSFQIRPSIFNDDEEFALLTRHDELLLRILYDPRLRSGMNETEAAPIVRQIAAELLPASAE